MDLQTKPHKMTVFDDTCSLAKFHHLFPAWNMSENRSRHAHQNRTKIWDDFFLWKKFALLISICWWRVYSDTFCSFSSGPHTNQKPSPVLRSKHVHDLSRFDKHSESINTSQICTSTMLKMILGVNTSSVSLHYPLLARCVLLQAWAIKTGIDMVEGTNFKISLDWW